MGGPWDRKVISRTAKRVHYASFVRHAYVGRFSDSLKRWREDVLGAEVIHAAD